MISARDACGKAAYLAIVCRNLLNPRPYAYQISTSETKRCMLKLRTCVRCRLECLNGTRWITGLTGELSEIRYENPLDIQERRTGVVACLFDET